MKKRLPISVSPRWLSPAIAACLFCLSLAVYVRHMAPSVVPGDPGEYQVIATQWGIGHPPGYGFYALFGNLFTRLVFWGSPAWRVNLLSAVCGAMMVALAYGIGWMLQPRELPAVSLAAQAPPILGAAVLATGLDVWQHAIHANAHIVTAWLATCALFCLVRWWRTESDRWLYAFCLIAGLSPVQHPLLVFAFPAYGLFVLVVRPRILREGRTIAAMFGFAALGLCAYLYYPIRCALGAPPAPGPSDMHTWAGFVRIVTAQGLRVNLGGFSVWDVLLRLWDVRVPLGLQYTWPTLLLAVAGAASLWARRWRPALLLTGYVACIVFVTVNVLQDAMAYLLGPVVAVGVFAGVGLAAAMSAVKRWRGVPLLLVVLAAILPIWSLVVNVRRMDLSQFRAADEWLAQMEARFGGQGQGAVVLAEWEKMTPLYYYAALDGRYERLEPDPSGREMWAADESDLRFVPVSAVSPTPFRDAASAFVSTAPTYLTSYRPHVADTYRLLPTGNLWQVLPAWPRELPGEAIPIAVNAEDRFEIVGWHLDQSLVLHGQVLLLDLYMRLPEAPDPEQPQFYLPWAQLGETVYRFTMNERFGTPWWQPGEIVVERFELPVPWHMSSGEYPLQVGVEWSNGGRELTLNEGETLVELTEVSVLNTVRAYPSEELLNGALGNLRGEVLVRKAKVNGRRVSQAGETIALTPGKTLHVLLEWESLVPIEENYKVFVQLLDTSLQVRAQGDDKAPLRGSAPTLLWFPRWRQGMRFADQYELQVPADLPPGHYPLVVGMYGFSTFKRAQTVSPDGDMAGDWVTVAHLEVR